MECLVCHQKIQPEERIFFGTQGVCLGETDWEYGSSEDCEGLVGAIHLSCLQSPTAAIVIPNTASPEPIEEELVVQRSDALALFDLEP